MQVVTYNFGSRCLATLLAASAGCGMAFAADIPERTAPLGPVGVVERPRRDYDALGYRSGNFIFYPSLISSATYDDNVFASRFQRVDDIVFHLIPQVTASGDFGTTAVSGYVNADGRLYARRTELNSVSPNIGVGFKSQIQRDLVVIGRADYGYKVEDPGDTQRLSGAGVIHGLVRYHDLNTSLSVNKDFGSFFLSAGTAYEHLAYNNIRDTTGALVRENRRDADLVTWTLRGGATIGPGLKVFVEPSANIKRYNASGFDSNGFRVVSGLSTEIGRLVTGEIYAGYTSQIYDRAFGTVSGFTAGGNVRWFPTQLLTITLKADRTIQDSGVTQGVGIGSPYFVTSVSGRADYELLRNLILTGSVGYQNSDYQRNAARTDNVYNTGATMTYLFNRFISGSLDYKYTKSYSTVATSRYDRNQYTASVKGQF